VNPMSATFEGRQAIAEQMGIQGDALFDFITTGSLRKVTEQRTLQLELVERNKAMLMRGVGLPPVDMDASVEKGEPVFVDSQEESMRVLRSDPHHLAIPAYLSVLNSPQARTEAKLTSVVLDVVSESLRLWAQLTKDECMAFGIPPLPSTLEAAIGVPGFGASPGPGAAPPPQTKPEAQPSPQGPPSELPAPASKMPEPPSNPQTGGESDVMQLGLPLQA
jgi:hypothetical protein